MLGRVAHGQMPQGAQRGWERLEGVSSPDEETGANVWYNLRATLQNSGYTSSLGKWASAEGQVLRRA